MKKLPRGARVGPSQSRFRGMAYETRASFQRGAHLPARCSLLSLHNLSQSSVAHFPWSLGALFFFGGAGSVGGEIESFSWRVKMTRRSVWGVIAVLALLFCVLTPKASAQAVYGSVFGTVTDPQGNSVAGAKVTVTSVTKGTIEQTTSNESGNYTVTHLIPDAYRVKFEAAGFKSYDVPSVQVSADAAVRLDPQLQVGAVTQTIEVTGELPQLKTDRADVAIEFNEKYVENLPILNRNFTNFELLSPGTQKLVGWSHAATENPQGGQQIFVNGQHFSGTAFELDGTDNQDPILGIIVVNPNLDAIQESKIALQNYDAEFGKAVAGVVTVQTKSGTNELHGSGFYDWRGDGQQARDPFKNAPGVALPHATFKQFGGAAGAPIIKNKFFVFGDYQGTRQTGGITNQLTIPTALVEQSCILATNTTGFCDLSEYLGNASINQGGPVHDRLESLAGLVLDREVLTELPKFTITAWPLVLTRPLAPTCSPTSVSAGSVITRKLRIQTGTPHR